MLTAFSLLWCQGLEHHRLVGQLVHPAAREMPRQMPRHRADSVCYRLFIISLLQLRFHRAADLLPLRAGLGVDAAIGDDLHVAVREQQVNQDAVVVLGVPYAQLREHLDGALARRLPPQERTHVERGLYREADLARMPGFLLLDCSFDCCHRGGRKGARDLPGESEQMSRDALQVHRHQRPEAPPPPKLPPPPRKPPPPNPPPRPGKPPP